MGGGYGDMDLEKFFDLVDHVDYYVLSLDDENILDDTLAIVK